MTAPKGDDTRRDYVRRTILWPAKLQVNDHTFDCQVWNVSLRGASVRIGLPLADGADVTLKIDRFGAFPGVIAWHERGNIGIDFIQGPATIEEAFGDYAIKLGLSQRDVPMELDEADQED